MPDAPTPAAAPVAGPAAATPTPTPAAPVAAPAVPAAPAVASLLDGAPAAPTAAVIPATPAAPAAAEPEWFYADGVKGVGKAPEWYKAAKYKSVDEQAKAYVEVEKMLGGFTGAPKDGKYEIKLPVTVTGELDAEHPMMVGLQKWAGSRQMSQEAFNEAIALFAEYEAAQAPNFGEIKKQLGDKADERIASVTQWAKANLDDAAFQQLREATAGTNAASVFAIVEATIAKTRQPALPTPGRDAASPSATGEAAIKAEMAKVGADGKLLFFSYTAEGQKHREKVEQMRINFYKAQPQAA